MTLNDILSTEPSENRWKLRVQGIKSESMVFIPLFYEKSTDYWYGWQTSMTSSRPRPNVARKKGSRNGWEVYDREGRKLPKNNWMRVLLREMLKIHKSGKDINWEDYRYIGNQRRRDRVAFKRMGVYMPKDFLW